MEERELRRGYLGEQCQARRAGDSAPYLDTLGPVGQHALVAPGALARLAIGEPSL